MASDLPLASNLPLAFNPLMAFNVLVSKILSSKLVALKLMRAVASKPIRAPNFLVASKPGTINSSWYSLLYSFASARIEVH
jgi:hypothetical protein